MATYSEEKKAEILKRLEAPENLTISQVSRLEKINKSTIHGWVKQAENRQNNISPSSGAKEWSSEEKFLVVMETYSLNEAESAEYARKKGIFLTDIKKWKENCFSANEKKVKISKDEKKTLEDTLKREKELIKTNKSQEKELIRKEKALAEAAALLILSKKAKAIWGESEDE